MSSSALEDLFHATWSGVTTDVTTLPSSLARVCAQVLGHDAGGLSVHGNPEHRFSLGASDEKAALAERLQFSYGDGPCFQAVREGRPVVVTDERWRTRWPVHAEEHFERTGFHGGLSLPLRVGADRFGVLDLYDRLSRDLTGTQVVDAQVVADLATAILLDHLAVAVPGELPPVRLPDERSSWWEGDAAVQRRQVWFATGMVGVALEVPVGQALSILRGHSFSSGRSLDDLADDIVRGSFDPRQLRMGTGA